MGVLSIRGLQCCLAVGHCKLQMLQGICIVAYEVEVTGYCVCVRAEVVLHSAAIMT